METKCKFSSCLWTGDVSNLLSHCEIYHPTFVKKINSDNAFFFVFDDIFEDAFLLASEAGLYWFLLDTRRSDFETYIRLGIFIIDNPDKCIYNIRVGQVTDEAMTYFGPYEAQKDLNQYDINWCFTRLETMHQQTAPKSFAVYFDKYDNCYTSNSEQKDEKDDFKVEDEEEYCNELDLDTFNCIVCFTQECDEFSCPFCSGYVSLDFMLEMLMNCIDDETLFADSESIFENDDTWAYIDEGEEGVVRSY